MLGLKCNSTYLWSRVFTIDNKSETHLQTKLPCKVDDQPSINRLFLTVSKLTFKDVTAFSGDKFDLKDWVNKTFAQPEAQQNKEVSRLRPLYKLLSL